MALGVPIALAVLKHGIVLEEDGSDEGFLDTPADDHCAVPLQEHGEVLSKRAGDRLALFAALNQRRERSEEHTSELQSPDHLVCRLLLEKKKQLETVQQQRLGRIRQSRRA